VSNSKDAIRRIVEAFEQSNWSEIDVRSGDVRVHLAAAAPSNSPAPPPVASATADLTVAGHAGVDSHPVVPGVRPPTTASHTDSLPAGAHVVVSASPGIFWCAAAPGLPPFVTVGDAVEPSTTMCIIEVMKLMSHVKAGVAGEVVAVYGKNGERVDKGEPLFAVAPIRSSS
jgi:acetyl-CoA carboxylase biotin carboxyl carrier protein